ncbi:MAG: L,D-transpeptidase [Solirubrobacterales bacterium]|nr:L,D-transpeptidase [Solirubrobacterales bacterium]
MGRSRATVLMLFLAVIGTWSLAVRSAVEPQRAEAAQADRMTTAPDPSSAQAARQALVTKLPAPRVRGTKRAGYGEPEPEPRHETIWVREGQSVELHAAPGGAVVASVGDTTEFGSASSFSVIERKGDWVGVPTAALPNGQLGWIELDPARVGEGSTEMSLEIDLSRQRAELLDGDRTIRAFTVTIGAPDSTTPIGRFSVTDELTSGLNPVYGCCAIALAATQPNVPADWSGGDRIAIHGSPEDTAGGATSNGCPHAKAADLQALIAELPLGAPVVIKA